MPHIIPIKDLKNTSEISELCHKTDELEKIEKTQLKAPSLDEIEGFDK